VDIPVAEQRGEAWAGGLLDIRKPGSHEREQGTRVFRIEDRSVR
jgi:hypothetical protein